MKKAVPAILLLFASLAVSAQQKIKIGGVVRSARTGETVIGAHIKADTLAATTSNEYGYYSLTVPVVKGETIDIEISATGLEPYTISIDADKDTTIDIDMGNSRARLDEVTIVSNATGRSLSSPQTSVEKLSTQEIKNIPVVFGEKDILKAIQLLPGIKPAGDGSSGMYVRGGGTDQNLILLDEAPVYNAAHLLGFFSTFNSDAVKDITVYKGGMPAQYGGRLSSVMDIKLNDGNNQDFGVSGGLGLISAKLSVEGPIQKGSSSFLVSGRRTYADLFLKTSEEYKDNELYFYDLNAKVNFQLGEKDRIYLSGYYGKDRLGAGFKNGDGFRVDWGNATGTLRWNHMFNNQLFSNTALIFSNYKYKISIKDDSYDFDIFSQIQDISLKEEIQWMAGNRNNIRMGFQSTYHAIRPGEVTSNDDSYISGEKLFERYSLDNAVYINNTWQAAKKLNIAYGVRFTMFNVLGGGDFYNIGTDGKISDSVNYKSGEVVKTYINFEPRLAVSYQLNEVSSVKGSFARNTQNLHLLSNSTTAMPTDKWLASNNNIKPEISDQVSIGYYRNFAGNNYELTVEGYYKTMQNQIDYKDGAYIYGANNAVETELLYGKGRSYGLEVLLKKKSGRLTGWLSYTLSKTERKIDGINNNEWYNARQDRTHDIALVANYQLSKKWTLSGNWVYYTGDAVTFPAGKYTVGGQTAYYYTERNGYRMPAYHRLDVGATWKLKKTRKWSHELAFSVFNLYGRENAYTIYFRDNKDNPEKTEAVKVALFKFIPSISYNFKF